MATALLLIAYLFALGIGVFFFISSATRDHEFDAVERRKRALDTMSRWTR